MIIYDFACVSCDTLFEELIHKGDPNPACTRCGSPTTKVLSAVQGWVESREERARKLKDRAETFNKSNKYKQIAQESIEKQNVKI